MKWFFISTVPPKPTNYTELLKLYWEFMDSGKYDSEKPLSNNSILRGYNDDESEETTTIRTMTYGPWYRRWYNSVKDTYDYVKREYWIHSSEEFTSEEFEREMKAEYGNMGKYQNLTYFFDDYGDDEPDIETTTKQGYILGFSVREIFSGIPDVLRERYERKRQRLLRQSLAKSAKTTVKPNVLTPKPMPKKHRPKKYQK